MKTDSPLSSVKSYLVGFVLCIILTLGAYFLVVNHLLTGWSLFYALASLAILQALAQLNWFLHLGNEAKPKWNLLLFLSMVSTLIILVWGSLWIMEYLNYRVMT